MRDVQFKEIDKYYYSVVFLPEIGVLTKMSLSLFPEKLPVMAIVYVKSLFCGVSTFQK